MWQLVVGVGMTEVLHIMSDEGKTAPGRVFGPNRISVHFDKNGIVNPVSLPVKRSALFNSDAAQRAASPHH